MQSITKARVDNITHKEANGDTLFSAIAMAMTRRIQAHMSLTRADDKAILPTSVLTSLSSARMRASTGKEVTDRATPRKRMKVPWCRCFLLSLRRKEKPAPIQKGKIMPAMPMTMAFLPVCLITEIFISTPTRNKKKTSPTFAIVSSIITLLCGNKVSANEEILPSTDGPNKIPPCNQTEHNITGELTKISDMTRGWRKGLSKIKKRRVMMTTIINCMVKRGRA